MATCWGCHLVTIFLSCNRFTREPIWVDSSGKPHTCNIVNRKG